MITIIDLEAEDDAVEEKKSSTTLEDECMIVASSIRRETMKRQQQSTSSYATRAAQQQQQHRATHRAPLAPLPHWSQQMNSTSNVTVSPASKPRVSSSVTSTAPSTWRPASAARQQRQQQQQEQKQNLTSSTTIIASPIKSPILGSSQALRKRLRDDTKEDEHKTSEKLKTSTSGGETRHSRALPSVITQPYAAARRKSPATASFTAPPSAFTVAPTSSPSMNDRSDSTSSTKPEQRRVKQKLQHSPVPTTIPTAASSSDHFPFASRATSPPMFGFESSSTAVAPSTLASTSTSTSISRPTMSLSALLASGHTDLASGIAKHHEEHEKKTPPLMKMNVPPLHPPPSTTTTFTAELPRPKRSPVVMLESRMDAAASSIVPRRSPSPTSIAASSSASTSTVAPYVSAERNRTAREALPGAVCKQCEAFYAYVGGGRENQKCDHVEGASRHRYEFPIALTPPSYWDVSSPKSTRTYESQSRSASPATRKQLEQQQSIPLPTAASSNCHADPPQHHHPRRLGSIIEFDDSQEDPFTIQQQKQQQSVIRSLAATFPSATPASAAVSAINFPPSAIPSIPPIARNIAPLPRASAASLFGVMPQMKVAASDAVDEKSKMETSAPHTSLSFSSPTILAPTSMIGKEEPMEYIPNSEEMELEKQFDPEMQEVEEEDELSLAF